MAVVLGTDTGLPPGPPTDTELLLPAGRVVCTAPGAVLDGAVPPPAAPVVAVLCAWPEAAVLPAEELAPAPPGVDVPDVVGTLSPDGAADTVVVLVPSSAPGEEEEDDDAAAVPEGALAPFAPAAS